MLLAAIDENHRGTYDFLYLPIDFKVNVVVLFLLMNCSLYNPLEFSKLVKLIFLSPIAE